MRAPRVGAITMVRNEGAMLHKWVDHYRAQFGADDLVVVDDNSDDGSTDDLGCEVVRIKPITGHFELSRMRLISEQAAKLLRHCDAVLFADADEFIVADPAKYDGLRDLVAARSGAPAVGVLGLNVIHHTATEQALDFGESFLGQRHLAKFVPLLCKPSIKWVANPWAAASHGIRDTTFQIDPELFMFHMKFADRAHLKRVADHRRSMVDLDGRAALTGWQFSGDDMVALLDDINAELPDDPMSVRVFRPESLDLTSIPVTFDNGVTRATGRRQVLAMRARPAVRIPERFYGYV
jgi:hypothetical protein